MTGLDRYVFQLDLATNVKVTVYATSIADAEIKAGAALRLRLQVSGRQIPPGAKLVLVQIAGG